ncbi:unnamed protein product [Arabidopsis halleri]
MTDCKPCQTPVDTKPKLEATDSPPIDNPTLYRSLAGALQYLTFTRPDIAYAVQQVCLFMHDPRESHFNTLKRILRYIKGTISHGIQLYRSSPMTLTAYSDADWAGFPTTRRSTSGYCVFLGDNIVSWSSKRQQVASRSSAEAEYRGVANVVAELTWLRNLLNEMKCPPQKASVVFCDNVSAVYLSTNPVQHQRTKHIEIDIHFVRERVALGQVKVLHVPSAHQYADIFTKGLPTTLFLDFRSSLSVRKPPARTAGGVRRVSSRAATFSPKPHQNFVLTVDLCCLSGIGFDRCRERALATALFSLFPTPRWFWLQIEFLLSTCGGRAWSTAASRGSCGRCLVWLTFVWDSKGFRRSYHSFLLRICCPCVVDLFSDLPRLCWWRRLSRAVVLRLPFCLLRSGFRVSVLQAFEWWSPWCLTAMEACGAALSRFVPTCVTTQLDLWRVVEVSLRLCQV